MHQTAAFELTHLADLDWIQIEGEDVSTTGLARMMAGLKPAGADLLSMSWTHTAGTLALCVLAPGHISGEIRARLRSRAQRMGARMRARRDLRAIVVQHRDPPVTVAELCARALSRAGIDIEASWSVGQQCLFLLSRERAEDAFVLLYAELTQGSR